MAQIFDGTTGTVPASWTTAGRPTSPSAGQTGYNTTNSQLEYWNGSSWIAVAATTNASLLTSGTLAAARLPTGSVLQVVRQTITTQASYTLNAGAIQSTALTASITPTSATSNIIVQIMASINSDTNGQGLYGEIRRGTSTTLNPSAGGGSYNYPIHWINDNSLPNMTNQLATQTWIGFDSPATTSATSYTFYVYGVSGTGSLQLNVRSSGTASSVILLWEIAG